MTGDAAAAWLTALQRVIDTSHLATGEQLSAVVDDAVHDLGLTAEMLLVDMAQRVFTPVHAGLGGQVDVVGTMAGRAYQLGEILPATSSSGFWFGYLTFPQAAFYSYTAPEPAGLAEAALPEPACWLERGGSHLAVLRYDDACSAVDPKGAVLDFLEAAYRAGAQRAGWDIDRYTCVDGATDPLVPG